MNSDLDIRKLLNSISHLAATNQEPATIHAGGDVIQAIIDHAEKFCPAAHDKLVVGDFSRFMGIKLIESPKIPADYFIFADAAGNIIKIGTLKNG